MQVEWDLGPFLEFPEPRKEEGEEEEDFDDFFAGYLTRLEPQYNTRLEELLEQFQNSAPSKAMRNTVADISLAVATLEVETQANMCASFIELRRHEILTIYLSPSFSDSLPEDSEESVVDRAGTVNQDFERAKVSVYENTERDSDGAEERAIRLAYPNLQRSRARTTIRL